MDDSLTAGVLAVGVVVAPEHRDAVGRGEADRIEVRRARVRLRSHLRRGCRHEGRFDEFRTGWCGADRGPCRCRRREDFTPHVAELAGIGVGRAHDAGGRRHVRRDRAQRRRKVGEEARLRHEVGQGVAEIHRLDARRAPGRRCPVDPIEDDDAPEPKWTFSHSQPEVGRGPLRLRGTLRLLDRKRLAVRPHAPVGIDGHDFVGDVLECRARRLASCRLAPSRGADERDHTPVLGGDAGGMQHPQPTSVQLQRHAGDLAGEDREPTVRFARRHRLHVRVGRARRGHRVAPAPLDQLPLLAVAGMTVDPHTAPEGIDDQRALHGSGVYRARHPGPDRHRGRAGYSPARAPWPGSFAFTTPQIVA
tara:strand:- start:46194 stop:47282 length:1089 start_codon:yes stop_codon:yes gene_type:complete